MKVLFIGGTGTISSACSEYCIKKGHELFLYNRAQSIRKPAEGANVIEGDYKNRKLTSSLLNNKYFDIIVNWLAFTPEDIDFDINLFRDNVGHYFFISSATVYKRPASAIPITEAEPLENNGFDYPKNKILCELRLHKEDRFPFTIIRPSHTYDKATIPMDGGYTTLHRLMHGERILLHGEGTALWTLTSNKDFAKGLVGLFGNKNSIREAFHITSDEALNWNQIIDCFAQQFNVNPLLAYLPSHVIDKYDKNWGNAILGDKTFSCVFDNSKIKSFVPDFSCNIPFAEGVKEICDWYSSEDNHFEIDPVMNEKIDNMINAGHIL